MGSTGSGAWGAFLVGLLAACGSLPAAPAGGDPGPRFCMAIDRRPEAAPRLGDGATPAEARHQVALRSVLWKAGSTLRIRFLDGDPGLRQRVRTFASEWTRHANLDFDWVDEGYAHIRIAFPGDGRSWSLLGTQALERPQHQATMSFGWFTPASGDEDLRRTTLHEFGHALGLEHEHQHPSAAFPWNRDAVIYDMRRLGWTEEMVEHNIFRRLDESTTRSSALDPDSIMTYDVPPSWTLDGSSMARSSRLSAGDQAFVAALYPGRSRAPVTVPPTPTPPTAGTGLRLANAAVAQADGRTWSWTAYLEGPLLPRVRSVRYLLHPTFTPNQVAVGPEAGWGFPFTTRGWGTFELGALATLDDGSQVRLRHMLVFAGAPAKPPARPVTRPRLALSNVARSEGLPPGGGYPIWAWTAFLVGEDVPLVEAVEYQLHPTFQPDRVKVSQGAEQGFPLSSRGWGTFRIAATARLRDGRSVRLEHDLRFR